MLRKMVSLLPVESLVVMSSKDSGGEKFRERKTLNFRNDRKMRARPSSSSSYSFIVQNQHNTAVMINNTLKI